MTSEATTRESAGDLTLVTKSRSLALPGRPLDHISQPVLNRPHDEPSRHWQLAEDNTSTGVIIEGWDTRTVTHILGYRAFSTQLLCEQVTGRALRRSNYDNYDEDGRLVAEYAEVIGVPFEFMPVKRPEDDPAPRNPATRFTASVDGATIALSSPTWSTTSPSPEPTGSG